MVDEDDVPAVLREILNATEMKQGQLAKKVGVSQGNISKWIAKIHSPNKAQWDQVLRFMRTDPRTRHLAGDSASIDAMLRDDPPSIRLGARRLVEIYLDSLRSRPVEE